VRRQGRWDESLARFNEALELDPRNLETLTHATLTYQGMRQFQKALQFIDRALDIARATMERSRSRPTSTRVSASLIRRTRFWRECT